MRDFQAVNRDGGSTFLGAMPTPRGHARDAGAAPLGAWRKAARRRFYARGAFTLVEVLMVILLISVLSAIILPSMNPSVYSQLQAAGEVVVNDLEAGRSLALTNSSTYSFTFDLTNNLYYLQYSGSNPALATLPSSPFYSAQDTPTRQITNLTNLPTLSGRVTLASVVGAGNSPRTQLEFGIYGQTTQVDETDIWLTYGSGSVQRWLVIQVNPVTGLATIGNFQAVGPSSTTVAGS